MPCLVGLYKSSEEVNVILSSSYVSDHARFEFYERLRARIVRPLHLCDGKNVTDTNILFGTRTLAGCAQTDASREQKLSSYIPPIQSIWAVATRVRARPSKRR